MIKINLQSYEKNLILHQNLQILNHDEKNYHSLGIPDDAFCSQN